MDDWTFVYVADIHVGTPRSYRFQPAWNENWQTARAQIVELDPEFLVVGGDLTRDGSTHRFELEQIKADLDALPFPYHVIPGNHEVGNKYLAESSVSIQQAYLDRYESVFGPDHWSFEHNGVRFSGFNAFLAGSGLPDEAEMWAWLEDQTRRPRARHHVWFLHPALFVDAPDEPNWDIAADRNAWYFSVDRPHRDRMIRVFQETGADLVVTAHIHCRRRVQFDLIVYQYAPATAFAQWAGRWPDGDPTLGFLCCQVTGTGVEPHFVPLKKTSDTTGYGPGGNPPLEGRDYRVAWEKPSLADPGFPGEAPGQAMDNR